jgi:thymidylate synthase (FAD)
MDYRVGGMELSAKDKKVIQRMLKGEKCYFENSKLSKREWNELMESFGFKEKIL